MSINCLDNHANIKKKKNIPCVFDVVIVVVVTDVVVIVIIVVVVVVM